MHYDTGDISIVIWPLQVDSLFPISRPHLFRIICSSLLTLIDHVNNNEVHNPSPRRDCAILTLAHETHQMHAKFDIMHKRRG